MKSIRDGTLSRDDAKRLIEEHATGKFASASVRRTAMRWLATIVEDDLRDRDVRYHRGTLEVKTSLSTTKPATSVLIVDGDLVVKGTFEDSLDPESVVIVTGDLVAKDVITEGFLEVHGGLCALGSALFLDNDGCAEIFGDLEARFVYTKYHAVNVRGVVRAKLVTGDAQHIRAKKVSFIEETDPRVKAQLSPKLLKVLEDEMFEEEDDEESDPDDAWIDYIDDDKLRGFVRRGGDPLDKPRPKTKRAK